MPDDRDRYWMQYALNLAEKAKENNEVPVGAVLIHENIILGEGFNQPISLNDPTAHAEVIALRNAAFNIKNYRLLDTTLYVTLEPCTMCAAALIHARIKRLVYAASDPKTGAVKSCLQLLDAPHFNHRVTYDSGILEEQSSKLLKHFFLDRR